MPGECLRWRQFHRGNAVRRWYRTDYQLLQTRRKRRQIILQPICSCNNLRRIRQLFWPTFTTLVVGGLFATLCCLVLGWWFGAEHMILMTMAPKSVTSPIAMLVAERVAFFRMRREIGYKLPKQKLARLDAFIDERRAESGIVYCAKRATVEEVCDHLRERGIAATRYHAGLTAEEREQTQRVLEKLLREVEKK